MESKGGGCGGENGRKRKGTGGRVRDKWENGGKGGRSGERSGGKVGNVGILRIGGQGAKKLRLLDEELALLSYMLEEADGKKEWLREKAQHSER
ncbi:hypothetical protein Tco_0742079 [Tanacetum coccineum]